MSSKLYDPERDPVRIAGRWVRWGLAWVAVPAILGVFMAGNIDVHALPIVGPERETAVLFQDGQAYFGHLDDSGESGTLVLRDAYYFADAKGGPTNLGVGLAKRGTEAHEPADGMRINRDKVLAIERVGPTSSVARAVGVQRELANAPLPAISLNRPAIAGLDVLAAQRVGTEHAIARGFVANADQLAKLNDLVLPISKSEAETITLKALDDLRSVRRSALAALARTVGMGAADADLYVRTTDTQLEGKSFATEQGVLLAPDLYSIVARATTLYAQVGDAASKLLTQPRSTPTPAPSATPAPTPTKRP